MAKLILLRHGQSQWNLENRFTGWVDVDLSPFGEQEASQAGQKLIHPPVDLVFTSSLTRAIRTADIALAVAGKTTLPVQRSQSLNERHYGDLQGLNKAETAAQYGEAQVQLWRRSYDVAPPNGESLLDTRNRVEPYFNQHIAPALQAGQNVLIVAHGNSLRAIIMMLENLTPEQIVEVEIPTGSPIQYDLSPQLTVVSKTVL